MMNTQGEFVETVNVKRWPTERPLFVIVLLCAILLWILFTVSIVGSDLLEACGDNTEARDMIIAHKLGHWLSSAMLLKQSSCQMITKSISKCCWLSCMTSFRFPQSR